MLRKIGTILLSGVILMSLCSCGKKDTEKQDTDNQTMTIHVFCEDNNCGDLLNYLNTIDKSLKIESHDIAEAENKELMEKVLGYFKYDTEKLETPLTIINSKVILGFDEDKKDELTETIKDEADKEYYNIVEKLEKGDSITDIESSIKDDEKDDEDEEKPTEEQKPSSDQEKPEESASVKYTVKKGDYLYRIAKLYQTTWKKIYEDNKSIVGDNPNLIKPGQVFTINGVSIINYTVKKGDYLSKIAVIYNTTWKKIYEDNKSVIGNNPNLIKPRQVLIINN